ncbi:MAG: SMC-Scp complex subunit ScpB [Bacteroidota bacterium]
MMDKIYNSVIEALIFASDESISSADILNSIKEIDGDEIALSKEDIDAAIDELNEKYKSAGLSFSIVKVAKGYLFATRPEYSSYVGYLSTEKSKRRLSQAAVETLSIIAYKQPITKPELEAIRGVNSDYIINMLLEKNLITITGRAESIGRPLLYGTTDEFLRYFGLYQISDLPKPREIDEIMKDQDFIEQRNKILMNVIEENLETGQENQESDDDGEA